MRGHGSVRWRTVVVPVFMWLIVALAASGCSDGPSVSSPPPGEGASAQVGATASATPETFRNLGKRAESLF